MNSDRDDFVALPDDHPLRQSTESDPAAERMAQLEAAAKDGMFPPFMAKGDVLTFKGVRWEIVRISTPPPRLTLKPIGRAEEGSDDRPLD